MNNARLDNINPDLIFKNPDNPRMIFREEDTDKLLNSIKKIGIRVPLSIYEEDKDKYVLLDGERRWRCATKLNLKSVPAIIEPKPNRLENILRMFDIHNVRVEWDLVAIALKLVEIEKLLKKEGSPHSHQDLSQATGLNISTIKRCFEILDLPDEYIELLKDELKKPKKDQKFTSDFFIEMLKALKTIERYTPKILIKTPKVVIMKKFVKKYRDGVITNIVKFRDVTKIARAEKAGISKRESEKILERLISDEKFTIEEAFQESVADAYKERTLRRDIEILISKLDEIKKKSDVDADIATCLQALKKTIDRILS